MIRFMLFAGMCLSCIATFSHAAVIYSNHFDTLPSITSETTGKLTWASSSIKMDVGNPPSAMRLSSGGSPSGPGAGAATFTWDLQASYDFFQGGNGEVKIDVSRSSTSSYVTVRLLEGTASRASVTHTFNDYSAWHTLSLPLDGNETAIDHIQFVIGRFSGTGGPNVDVDNFLAIAVPEPATVTMFGIFLAGALLTRRRSE